MRPGDNVCPLHWVLTIKAIAYLISYAAQTAQNIATVISFYLIFSYFTKYEPKTSTDHAGRLC